jgi:hypothetical protein
VQPNLLQWYEKYDGELRELARALRARYHQMESQGFGTAFSDVEGELLYMLVREAKPELAFEVSPNAGWSTNYILAALTANARGILHSFEILPNIRGRATEEVIRGNFTQKCDPHRLTIHIGDARTTTPDVKGKIGFLLLDSCHEGWFADWYIQTLLPRVEGPIFIQDIAFVDSVEGLTEAQHVWNWIQKERVPALLVGRLQQGVERSNVRSGYPERRGLRSNGILLWAPWERSGSPPELEESPEGFLGRARQEPDLVTADRLANQAVSMTMENGTRIFRFRVLLQAGDLYRRLGEKGEARRCYQRALGLTVQSDDAYRPKGLAEILNCFLRRRLWRLAAQTSALMWFEPRSIASWFKRAAARLKGQP